MMKLKAASWRKRLARDFTDDDDNSMLDVAETWADEIEKIKPSKHEAALLNERLILIATFTPDIIFGSGATWNKLKKYEAKKRSGDESAKVAAIHSEINDDISKAVAHRSVLIKEGWASEDYSPESAYYMRTAYEMASELAHTIDLYDSDRGALDLAQWLWSPAGSPQRTHPDYGIVSKKNRHSEHVKELDMSYEEVSQIALADLRCHRTKTEELMLMQKETLEEAIKWRENIVHLMVSQSKEEQLSHREENRRKFTEALKREAKEWVTHESLIREMSACQKEDIDHAGFGILEARYTKDTLWHWWEDAAASVSIEEEEGTMCDESSFWLMAGVAARTRVWSFLWGTKGAAHALIGRSPKALM